MRAGTHPDDTAFLQERLAKLSVVSGTMAWTALAFRVPQQFMLSLEHPLLEASMLAHALGATVPLLVWLTCQRRGLSRRTLEALDGGMMILTAVAYGVMGRQIFLLGHSAGLAPAAELTVLLAMSFTALSRAVFVPSSGRRTFTVTLASAVGFLFLASGADSTMAYPGQVAGPSVLGVMLVHISMWWTLTTGLATLASTTIFGLRREAQEARTLGQYILEERIGEGGMGIVHRARHAMLRRPTAVKLLRPERAGAQAIARFEREVRETARLSHPNTVTVFDYGRTPEGIFYYAMELLDGATLDVVLEIGGPLPPSRVIHVLRQVASALVEAHGAGLVHRDLKPSNIALCKQGGALDVAKVLDFGLVQEHAPSSSISGGRGDGPSVGRSASPDSPITGTPLYLAPETLSGQASPASDIYALGIVAYQLLVGDVPFHGRTVLEICAQHLDAPPPRAIERARQSVPEALDALVFSCLAKSPQDRPESARALEVALAELDVPLWTEKDAGAWWAEHGAAVAERRVAAGGDPTRPLEVDWARR